MSIYVVFRVQGRQIQGNAKLKSFLSTGDGRLVAGVLREFLEFYGLHYTASVFEPEAGAVSGDQLII